MSKRFTDTDKWDRPWFRKLPTAYKLLWQYVTDKCDFAGIWYVDFDLASFVIGEKLAPDVALKLFEKQITVLGDGSRWFVRDFYAFQYGNLQPTNNLHRSVLARLRSLGLAPEEPQTCPSGGAKVKEKDSLSLNRPGLEEIRAYCRERGNSVDPEKWLAYYESNGWRVGKNPMKDWKAAVRTWEKSEFNQPPAKNQSSEFVA